MYYLIIGFIYSFIESSKYIGYINTNYFENIVLCSNKTYITICTNCYIILMFQINIYNFMIDIKLQKCNVLLLSNI